MNPFFASLRDTALVARFHLARALRTRSALALALVYTLVATGGAWVFTRVLLQIERGAARTLRVPETDKPGAMLGVLEQRGELNDLFAELTGDPALVSWALDLPFLTVVHFWLALGVLPFLAAAAGSETVAPDIRNRALRYELLRTGRLELVVGRFLGQALLVCAATLLSVLGTWTIAMTAMVQQPPVEQLTSLLTLTPRLWAWSLPFLGLGVAASQITGNVNLARSFGLAAATSCWILWGVLQSELLEELPMLEDVLAQVLPQGYLAGLWGPGFDWLAPAGIIAALAVAFALVPFPFFARRNL